MTTPYLIAELGLLHYRNVDGVRDTARKVKRAGFHALKIQHYTTEDMLLEKKITQKQYGKYAERQISHLQLSQFALAVREEGLDFGITAHNMRAALDLPPLDFYKLGHGDTDDTPLCLEILKQAVIHNKRLFVSVKEDEEKYQAICNVLYETGLVPYTILGTTTEYPTTDEDTITRLFKWKAISSHIAPELFPIPLVSNLTYLELHVKPDIEPPSPVWESKDLSCSWSLSDLPKLTAGL